MRSTHQKRAYRARALQWDGTNTLDIIDALRHEHVTRLDEHPEYLIIRHAPHISCLSLGDWVVVGENGAVKTYTDVVFKTKYEEIT